MDKVAVIYNSRNKLKMSNIHSSLKYHNEEIGFMPNVIDSTEIIITDNVNFFGKKAVLVISNTKKNLDKLINNKLINDIIIIQYESELIKEIIEKKYTFLNGINSVIINAIPEQKHNINTATTLSPTIFYQGKDKPEDMVDSMFDLDLETHFEIVFYDDKVDFEPSKRHKLSWCVTKNKNNIGIINYKIIKEIENGCLPILIKEYMPKSFFAYPFYVSLDDLKNNDKLIARVKEVSSIISKMTKEEYSVLANSIYNGIYINSEWKWKYFLISEEINRHINN